jgi:DNA-binding transcriptional ArsR family regulator
LAEASEYDEIFAALKHPVRRQILLFLDRKGEASFTDIQEEVGINDTGRMSYHLKELAPLLEQSKRGKYCLSEIGHAGVELFRKVEHERQRSSTAVRKEIEKYLGETIRKSVFLLCIAGLTLFVPMSVDIALAVQGLIGNGFSTIQLVGMLLLDLFAMIGGLTLFTMYDRHYYSKNLRTSIFHSTIFAIILSVLSSLSFYSIYSFNKSGFELGSQENLSLMFGFLRIVFFLASSPVIAYAFNRVDKHRKDAQPNS